MGKCHTFMEQGKLTILWLQNILLEILGIDVYTIVSKTGLKSHGNQSVYMKNLILWVCREC